ncbi:MAG: hypothetical protein KDB27_11025 [Planctomycetales bacterium]|nr:hypothetical protein [Planctomycetales bacterium]
MSNRNQTPRDRQPEWNAPLVSLPDISQIINGDGKNGSQIAPVSVTECAAVDVEHFYSVPEEPSPTSEYRPILVAKQPAVAHTTTEQDSGSPALRRVDHPQPAKTIDSNQLAEVRQSVELDQTAGSKQSIDSGIGESAETAVEPAAKKLVGIAFDWKRWSNALVFVGSVAATIAILSILSGGNPESEDQIGGGNRTPLHDEPLDQSQSLEASFDAEPLIDESDLGIAAQADVAPEVELPAAEVTPSAPGSTTGKLAEMFAVPEKTLPYGPPHDAQSGIETPAQVASHLESQQDTQPNSYRHIERYQPAEDAFLQAPANRESNTQAINSEPNYGDTGTAGRSFDTYNPIQSADAATDSPYYERTSPSNYLWPEDANELAIRYLSRPTRR